MKELALPLTKVIDLHTQVPHLRQTGTASLSGVPFRGRHTLSLHRCLRCPWPPTGWGVEDSTPPAGDTSEGIGGAGTNLKRVASLISSTGSFPLIHFGTSLSARGTSSSSFPSTGVGSTSTAFRFLLGPSSAVPTPAQGT